MGKSLKGKELGKGISQRKDGLYSARFVKRNGQRVQKYFNNLPECRKWIAEEQFKDEHSSLEALDDMIVGAWFEYWINEVKGQTIRNSTKRGYLLLFEKHIKPVLGEMRVSDVRSIHCQKVLNQMVEQNLKQGSINDVRMKMHAMFECAVENKMITHNPVSRSVKSLSHKTSEQREAMTLAEQKIFFEALLKTKYEKKYGNQFRLILQTGLRCGELAALQWGDIDFNNKVMHITKSMSVWYPNKHWVIEKPKTKAGIRDIPLTEQAIYILKKQKEQNKILSLIPLEYANYVFLNEKGMPISNANYDAAMRRMCNKYGLRRISMHILRHTFATRCIEAGMKPNVLQKILGHTKLSVTMDLYVRVTEDEKYKEMQEIQQYLEVV